jgi:hypothetical protein
MTGRLSPISPDSSPRLLVLPCPSFPAGGHVTQRAGLVPLSRPREAANRS